MTDLNAAIGVRRPSAHLFPPTTTPRLGVLGSHRPWCLPGLETCPALSTWGPAASPYPHCLLPPVAESGERRGASQADLGGLPVVLCVEEMLPLLQQLKAGCGDDGWCVSLCPGPLWPGWRWEVATIPTPRLFPQDHGGVGTGGVPHPHVMGVGPPICPRSSCRRVGGGSGRDVVALQLGWGHLGRVPCPVPWLSRGCLAAVLMRPFGSALSSCSSSAPAPDPAPLTPCSPHPADPPPLRHAAYRPRGHRQRLGAAGTLGGTGGPGPAPRQRRPRSP